MGQVFAESRQRVNELLERERSNDVDDDAPLPSVAMPLTETSKGSGSGARSRSLGSSPAGVVGIADAQPAAPTSRFGLALAVVAIAGLLAGFFVLRPRFSHEVVATSPTAASAASAEPRTPPAGNVPTAPAVVELVVDVSPDNAQVSLDGVLLTAGNPYRKRVERDDKPHELEISAPGHETRRETVVLSGNVTLRLALVKADPRTAGNPAPGSKKKASAGAAAAEPTTASDAPPAGGPPIKGGVAPKRDINTANPYGN